MHFRAGFLVGEYVDALAPPLVSPEPPL